MFINTALLLSSQADIERGFSTNKLLLLEQRSSIKNKSVITLRTIKNALRSYNSVEEIPLPIELFRKHPSARSAYKKKLAANTAVSNAAINKVAGKTPSHKTATILEIERSKQSIKSILMLKL